jgi:hypothetical protein
MISRDLGNMVNLHIIFKSTDNLYSTMSMIWQPLVAIYDREDCRASERDRPITVLGNANMRPGPFTAAKSRPAVKVK